MKLGYKAHEDSYSALGGTETGWQAEGGGRGEGGTWKALKLHSDGAGGDIIVTRGTIHGEGRFRHFYITGGVITRLEKVFFCGGGV